MPVKPTSSQALITNNPETIDWGIQKIRVLWELGQHQEARKAYLHLYQKLGPQIASIQAMGKKLQDSPRSTEALEIQKQAESLAKIIHELTALAQALQFSAAPSSQTVD